MIVDEHQQDGDDRGERREVGHVLGADQERIPEEKVFEAEELPALHDLAKHGGQADGPGEEDADDGVAGQAGAVANRGDAVADERANASMMGVTQSQNSPGRGKRVNSTKPMLTLANAQ